MITLGDDIMNKIKFAIAGFMLGCISFAAYADRKECNLGEWCAMARASDYADINIYTEDGANYTCTLSVDGTYDANKSVQVLISGRQGFEMKSGNLSAHQGGSTQVRVKGKFTDPKGDPVISARRLPNDNADATNKTSYIMCEKGIK